MRASRVTDADHDVRIAVALYRARCLVDGEPKRGSKPGPSVEEVFLHGREDVLLGEPFVDAPVVVENIQGEVAVLSEREARHYMVVPPDCCDLL